MYVELAGQQFGRLVVLQYAGRIRGVRHWHCGCACGNVKVLREGGFNIGSVKSCGCLKHERRKRGEELVPGLGTICGKHARTYITWQAMLRRCDNPHNKNYKHYGGRGIQVCRRWLESFDNFLDDMGERPLGLSLERIDNDRGYSPANCKWATDAEQSVNKRNTLFVTYKGRTLTLIALAKEMGVKYSVLAGRVRTFGWSIERALTERIKTYNTSLITHKNRTQSLSAWARELGISYQCLFYRLKQGWTVEEAFTKPTPTKKF